MKSIRQYLQQYKISCLSVSDTQRIVRYVTPVNKFKFMIPFIDNEQLNLLKSLKESVPFKYIIFEKEFIITSVEYNVMNDYIITKFK